MLKLFAPSVHFCGIEYLAVEESMNIKIFRDSLPTILR